MSSIYCIGSKNISRPSSFSGKEGGRAGAYVRSAKGIEGDCPSCPPWKVYPGVLMTLRRVSSLLNTDMVSRELTRHPVLVSYGFW